MLNLVKRLSLAIALAALLIVMHNVKAAEVSGELMTWHKITLDFKGPMTSESATPNPFTDYRLDVTFTQGDKSFTVPGYYAADGNSANTSADKGDIWRVHFAAPTAGKWQWKASFRKGKMVAVAEPGTGEATDFDGTSGGFMVARSDKSGRDMRAKGRLKYVGGHYPRFTETGEYFLKQGPDAPENLLAYRDFDGDFKTDGHKDNLIKDYGPHIQDWRTGDPTWGKDAKGKGLIGAVNYLASEGLNVISFLPMNVIGDDRNVFPYTTYKERFRIDCSKVDQWGIVLDHATNSGFFLHFKTQETENDQLLDKGNLGPERKFYYRELIARFSHHPALNWNLGEENTNTTQQVKAFCDFFEANDPYGHLVVMHTYPGGHQDKNYTPLLGYPNYDGLSVQTNSATFNYVHRDVGRWVKASAKNGRKWVVACDEPGDAQHSLRPDSDPGNAHEDGRKNALWGTLCGGGWGNEWYFGYKHAHSDLTLQDFRSRDKWWDYCRHALHFWTSNNIPYWEMVNDNTKLVIDGPAPAAKPKAAANKEAKKPAPKKKKKRKSPAMAKVPASQLGTHGYCFMKAGEIYVVFLKNASYQSELDLTGIEGDFAVSWFDPRKGGNLQSGSVENVKGGGKVTLGEAPSEKNKDWAILVAKK